MLAHHHKQQPVLANNQHRITEIRKRWQLRKQKETEYKFKYFRRPL